MSLTNEYTDNIFMDESSILDAHLRLLFRAFHYETPCRVGSSLKRANVKLKNCSLFCLKNAWLCLVRITWLCLAFHCSVVYLDQKSNIHGFRLAESAETSFFCDQKSDFFVQKISDLFQMKSIKQTEFHHKS